MRRAILMDKRITSEAVDSLGRIVACCGGKKSSEHAYVELIEMSGRRHYEIPCTFLKRRAGCAVVIGSQLYVMGGMLGRRFREIIEIYPIGSNYRRTIHVKNPLKFHFTHAAAIAIPRPKPADLNDKIIYIVGGKGPRFLPNCAIFDPITKALTEGPSLTSSRADVALATFNMSGFIRMTDVATAACDMPMKYASDASRSYIFAVGGAIGADARADIEMLDTEDPNAKWVYLPPMFTSRCAPIICATGGRFIWVFGGYEKHDKEKVYHTSIEVFDTACCTWINVGHINIACAHGIAWTENGENEICIVSPIGTKNCIRVGISGTTITYWSAYKLPFAAEYVNGMLARV